MSSDWNSYFRGLNDTWWQWAARNHPAELDGVSRASRPPVFANGFEELNVIVPEDREFAEHIRRLIPRSQRHRGFASMRSSQALAQSVFGAIAAGEILNGIIADCGQSAFGNSKFTMDMEYEVHWLGEPRPTSIDVFLRGSNYRVAVECKFTEREFGLCSRPNLTPNDDSYEEQFCDGSYSRQRNRIARCSLTEIGALYWEVLPDLFQWKTQKDIEVCPFANTYQLARNALAACTYNDGIARPDTGHVLVVYDARNPEFHNGGKALAQFDEATGASLVPGLFRKLSWQNLIAQLTDFDWLDDAIRQRHGIIAEKL